MLLSLSQDQAEDAISQTQNNLNYETRDADMLMLGSIPEDLNNLFTRPIQNNFMPNGAQLVSENPIQTLYTRELDENTNVHTPPAEISFSLMRT